jgi:DsbC/DsbD-like thiol-disulfide interchange protein
MRRGKWFNPPQSASPPPAIQVFMYVFHVSLSRTPLGHCTSRRFQWHRSDFDRKAGRMAIKIEPAGLAAAACMAVLAFSAADFAAADDTTRWSGDARSGMRMIAGVAVQGADELRAGVEIRLLPGWHTYWRYPGDAGVPPQFTFAGSNNIRKVEVRWPAPERINEGGGTSIGYWKRVIFPLRVTRQDASRPVELRLRLHYAICEKLCVPMEAIGKLILPSQRSPEDAALTAAEARVPKQVNVGEDSDLSIRRVFPTLREGGTKPVTKVEVAGPPEVDLFVEGPTPQWALPVPTPVGGAPAGRKWFVFEHDGAPPGESYRGALLTFTAVTPTRAIEVATRLD